VLAQALILKAAIGPHRIMAGLIPHNGHPWCFWRNRMDAYAANGGKEPILSDAASCT